MHVRRFAAVGADLLGDLLAGIVGHVGEDDLGTFDAKSWAATHPARASRDQRHLARAVAIDLRSFGVPPAFAAKDIAAGLEGAHRLLRLARRRGRRGLQ